ncbi:MAG: metal-dependent hydrolase [Planctomycetota bacterium]|nr:metal-dependent hydrolase [Planctomycetota bacterium]
MDPITHGLLGAAVAQLGFRQRIGRDASWLAAAAAMAPDIDILVAPLITRLGSNGNNHFLEHRGLSHSLLLAPLLAATIAGGWWMARRLILRRWPPKDPAFRPTPFWLLYACTVLAFITHPLLDWCTPYGTELLAPLSDARYAADCVSIVDFLFTGILVLGLIACFAARRLRPHLEPQSSRMLGRAGFMLAVAYLFAGHVLHNEVVEEARIRLAESHIVRADAYPALGTICPWRVVVEADDAWTAMRIRPLAKVHTPPPTQAARKQSSPWIDRARELPQAREYEWFAMGRVRTTYREEDGLHIVELSDMRYSPRLDGIESLWPLQVTFDAAGNLLGVERLSAFRGRSLWTMLQEAWENMAG